MGPHDSSNPVDFVSTITARCQDFAILCGSGISTDAGVPSADAFIKAVCSAIEQPLAEFHRSDLRFEGFLEVLQRTIDPEMDLLKEVVRVGRPVAAHRALAKLASERLVVTTNFDELIEATGLPANRVRVTPPDDPPSLRRRACGRFTARFPVRSMRRYARSLDHGTMSDDGRPSSAS